MKQPFFQILRIIVSATFLLFIFELSYELRAINAVDKGCKDHAKAVIEETEVGQLIKNKQIEIDQGDLYYFLWSNCEEKIGVSNRAIILGLLNIFFP